jgi:hypothetical protein
MHKQKKLVFCVFAVAILVSVMREWNAPVACLRLPMQQGGTFSSR